MKRGGGGYLIESAAKAQIRIDRLGNKEPKCVNTESTKKQPQRDAARLLFVPGSLSFVF